jgi:hypothetical protein
MELRFLEVFEGENKRIRRFVELWFGPQFMMQW